MFQDHIYVSVDAENFFFLHDLISSYINDTKDKKVWPNFVFLLCCCYV